MLLSDGNDSRRRDPDEPQAGVPDEAEIDRNGFGPAETKDEQYGRADGNEVPERIEGESAHGFGRRISHEGSHPAVRQLVDDDVIQKRIASRKMSAAPG